MIQKIKNFVLVGMTGFMLFAPALLVPAVSHADIKGSLCTGSTSASSTTGTGTDCGSQGGNVDTGLKNLAGKITNWFTIVVGALSIIMIIYGGFRYITSGGDSGRVGSAKNTIIYAIIGLIIVALAQIIVNVVINQAGSSTTTF